MIQVFALGPSDFSSWKIKNSSSRLICIAHVVAKSADLIDTTPTCCGRICNLRGFLHSLPTTRQHAPRMRNYCKRKLTWRGICLHSWCSTWRGTCRHSWVTTWRGTCAHCSRGTCRGTCAKTGTGLFDWYSSGKINSNLVWCDMFGLVFFTWKHSVDWTSLGTCLQSW